MATTTITITAFGYEHELSDCWNAEEIEMMQDAPYLHILSGSDEAIDLVAGRLPMDAVLLWTDAGEALVFGYEDFELETYELAEAFGVEIEMEDRGEERAA